MDDQGWFVGAMELAAAAAAAPTKEVRMRKAPNRPIDKASCQSDA
jgi:hypothetical protein